MSLPKAGKRLKAKHKKAIRNWIKLSILSLLRFCVTQTGRWEKEASRNEKALDSISILTERGEKVVWGAAGMEAEGLVKASERLKVKAALSRFVCCR